MNKNIKKEAAPTLPPGQTPNQTGDPAKSKGYVPGAKLTTSELDLANVLKQIHRYATVKGDKNQIAIMKLPNGMFSIKTLVFAGETKPNQMPASTVIHGIADLVGDNFHVITKENKTMDNMNIVKKNLLQRKIKEHFSKNPKSKSVIVSVNIGEQKTIWKVNKAKVGYSVVEVNTHKEQFMLEGPMPVAAAGAPQQGSAEFKQVMGIIGPIMGNLGTSQAQAAEARNQINTLIGRIKNPKEKAQAGAFLNYLGALTSGMAGASPQAPIAQAQGAVPKPSGNTGLASGRTRAGSKLHEKEEKDKKKTDKRPEDMPKKSPSSVKPAPETAPEDPQAAAQPEPEAAGMETPGPADAPAPEAPPEEPKAPDAAPKTGEELSLQSLVKTKPVKDIQVFGDEKGGHVMLSMGGLKNAIQLNFGYDGKITYKFGELSRVLKAGK